MTRQNWKTQMSLKNNAYRPCRQLSC